MSHNHSECIENLEKFMFFYIWVDLFDSGVGSVEDKFNNELFDDRSIFAFGTDVVANK